MGLRFDRDVGYLWAQCDNSCGNKLAVLAIDTTPGSPTFGRVRLRRTITRPSTLPDSNHEGITMAPESRCVAGFKPFFWVDDSAAGGRVLRVDSVPCGAFIP